MELNEMQKLAADKAVRTIMEEFDEMMMEVVPEAIPEAAEDTELNEDLISAFHKELYLRLAQALLNRAI